MPILVYSTEDPVTPEEMEQVAELTTAKVLERLVPAVSQAVLTSTLFTDKVGTKVTLKISAQRQNWLYEANLTGGKVATALGEILAEAKLDSERDAVESAEQDQIRAALQNPILP